MGLLVWLVRLLVIALAVRLLLRFLGGVRQGLQGGARRATVDSGRASVPLVRDPICGTYVVKERAFVSRGTTPAYFCSETCKRRYEAAGAGSQTA